MLVASLLSERVARVLERPFLFLDAPADRPRVERLRRWSERRSRHGPVRRAGPRRGRGARSERRTVTWRVVLVTVAYSMGHAIPLLALAIGSQRLTSGMRVVRTHAHVLRQGAGVVLGLTAVAIAVNVPERLATAVPGYTQSFQERIERSPSAWRAREIERRVSGGRRGLGRHATGDTGDRHLGQYAGRQAPHAGRTARER